VQLYQAAAKSKEGGDAAIGPRLLGMALDARLVEVRVGLVVPTFRDGEGKRVAQVTMEHIREAVVGAELATSDEVNAIVGELSRFATDDRTLMSRRPRSRSGAGRPTRKGRLAKISSRGGFKALSCRKCAWRAAQPIHRSA
jgi:hypothetical protein